MSKGGGLSESVHQAEETMNTTHMQILISVKSPITDENRKPEWDREYQSTTSKREVVQTDHASSLPYPYPTLEEIGPSP